MIKQVPVVNKAEYPPQAPAEPPSNGRRIDDKHSTRPLGLVNPIPARSPGIRAGRLGKG